jgi:penicillin-binding protein 1C
MNDESDRRANRRIFTPETASLIGDILSDPDARRLEFGNGSLLRFPVQTAVKTGTSSDYRDAWALGFNDRFTAGVWIGNLNHQAMDGITGTNGAALILRSVFAELNRHLDTRPLYLSPRLAKADICRNSGLPADGRCESVSEWFAPGTGPGTAGNGPKKIRPVFLKQPTEGLQLAMDPRVPDSREAFSFILANFSAGSVADWYVDGRLAASTSTGEYLWPLKRGRHAVKVRFRPAGSDNIEETAAVGFTVK